MAARTIAVPQQRIRKAFGISRVSLLIQVDNYSLDAQKAKLAGQSEKFGFEIPEGYLIDDEGYSGTNFNRPAIKTTLRRIRNGEAEAVVFPYLDRFARNVEGGLNMIRQFREAGAEVLLGDYGWVTDERDFKMRMHFGLMMAEYQRDDIQEKSRSGVLTKIARGLAHGGRSPFGWHFVTALEIAAAALNAGLPVPTGRPQNVHARREADIETVRFIGELVKAGAGQREICRELLQRGTLSPSGKTRWNPTMIAKIVRDPIYSTGLWYYGKREAVKPDADRIRKPNAERHREKSSQKMKPQSQWGPSQKLPGGAVWTPAEQEHLIETMVRNGQRKGGKPAAAASQGGFEALLKRLMVCDEIDGEGKPCGYAVVPQQKTTPKGRKCWYGCSHRDRITGEMLCPGRYVRAEVIEETVKNALREALTERLDELVERYRVELSASIDAAELERLKADEQRLLRKKQEAIDRELDADDLDDKRQYASRVVEYKAALALTRRRIASFTSEMETIEVDTASIKRDVADAMRTTERAEMREILVGWIHQVAFSSTRDEATITIRVPLRKMVANCQRDEPDVYSYILLKTKVMVAA